MILGAHTVFFSTLTYELGRQLGIARAQREFLAQCQNPTRASLPVARMAGRLRQLADVELFHGASTTLPKARSRAAHAALRSKADFWLMCDDDVECDSGTLQRMFAAAGDPDSFSAVVLPCLMRGDATESSTVNVTFADPPPPLESVGGATVRKCIRAGTGCLLLTRAALEEVSCLPLPLWIDDDGEQKCPVFDPIFNEAGQWLGEDLSFCQRLTGVAGVELRALLSGASSHAGNVLSLDSIR